ncbi:C-type lectin domain family 4 member E isoform X3 [Esox lucius]|uniref:C-type lectin domain family 4 member E isoform X3 n=1 Tax=Esox lucius TaxID=8010 RepID=UPI00147769E3|nr:C-type lectin domain family 4 member E isoform X3 [Esox lucius]
MLRKHPEVVRKMLQSLFHVRRRKSSGKCERGVEAVRMAEMIYSNVTFTPHPNRDAGLRSNVNEAMEHEEDVTYSEVRTGAGQQANAQKDAEEARSRAAVAQMMENLTVRKELLSSELQHCEKNLTEFSNNLTAIKAIRCASGWEFYNGSCYHFSEDILNWEQSQYACIREGGHLVIIESQQEQNFIRLKVGNMNDQNNYWIGMTDMKEEGVWVWMDNTPLNKSIKYWDLNNGTHVSAFPEPNDWKPGEDCAQMGQRCSGQISCWLDNACDKPSKRICESRAVRS